MSSIDNDRANCTILVSTAEHPSALSLAILHLQFSRKAEGEAVTVTTAANESVISTSVRAVASYDQPVLVDPVTNYLEYGSSLELLHLDPVTDGRVFKEEHIYSPGKAVSGLNTPPSITVRLDNWGSKSSALLVFTAYRVRDAEDHCRKEEFDCSPHQGQGGSKDLRFCLAKSLVCDGIPNCGVPAIPGPDEDCGEVQWVFFLIGFLLFVVIVFFLIFLVSIITTRYHMLYPHIHIPLVKIFKSDDDAVNLVGE